LKVDCFGGTFVTIIPLISSKQVTIVLFFDFAVRSFCGPGETGLCYWRLGVLFSGRTGRIKSHHQSLFSPTVPVFSTVLLEVLNKFIFFLVYVTNKTGP
jgi:hypothetical protein